MKVSLQTTQIPRKRFYQAIENVHRHREFHTRATDFVGKIYRISHDERVMMCLQGQKRWKNYLTTVKYFEKKYLKRMERDLNSEILLNECIVEFRCDVKSQSFYNPTLHTPLDIHQMGL